MDDKLVRIAIIVDAKADDPLGVNPDDSAVAPIAGSLGLRLDRLGVAADLKAADPPGVSRDKIIDDEGHPAVVGHVAELPTGGHIDASHIDAAGTWIERKADWAGLQCAVWVDGGDSADSLGRQVAALSSGEGRHEGSERSGGQRDLSPPPARARRSPASICDALLGSEIRSSQPLAATEPGSS